MPSAEKDRGKWWIGNDDRDPLLPAENDTRHPLRWVACSVAEFGYVGEQRHLARRGALTTYCGHSATHPNIWRGNKRKPKCLTCEAAEARVTPPAERTNDE